MSCCPPPCLPPRPAPAGTLFPTRSACRGALRGQRPISRRLLASRRAPLALFLLGALLVAMRAAYAQAPAPAEDDARAATPEIERAVDCMLHLGAADHFFQDARNRRRGDFDEAVLPRLKPAWNKYNAALGLLFKATGWDAARREQYFQEARQTFWAAYLDRKGEDYQASKAQLRALATRALACKDGAAEMTREVLRGQEYDRLVTCVAVARPLGERMAVDPAFGAALGVTADEVNALGEDAARALQRVAGELGRPAPVLQEAVQSRFAQFWQGPDPGDGSTLGDRVLAVLRSCQADADLRRELERMGGASGGRQ